MKTTIYKCEKCSTQVNDSQSYCHGCGSMFGVFDKHGIYNKLTKEEISLLLKSITAYEGKDFFNPRIEMLKGFPVDYIQNVIKAIEKEAKPNEAEKLRKLGSKVGELK